MSKEQSEKVVKSKEVAKKWLSIFFAYNAEVFVFER